MTAIQQAIKALEKLQQDTGSSQAAQISILQLVLPTERKQIEEAFTEGIIEQRRCYAGASKGDLSASDYYTSNLTTSTTHA